MIYIHAITFISLGVDIASGSVAGITVYNIHKRRRKKKLVATAPKPPVIPPPPTRGKMARFYGLNWYPVDPDLIAKYRRDNRVSNIRVYTTGPAHGPHRKIENGIDDFAFYKDSAYYFNLVVQDKTAACIGFRITDLNGLATTRGRVVVIEQIQGRAQSKNALSKIKWERFLIEVVIDWARTNNMLEVRVINADQQNYWPNKNESVLKTHEDNIARYKQKIAEGAPPPSSYYAVDYWQKQLEGAERQAEAIVQKMQRFIMHYNVTPKRMGFKQVEGYHFQRLELKIVRDRETD